MIINGYKNEFNITENIKLSLDIPQNSTNLNFTASCSSS